MYAFVPLSSQTARRLIDHVVRPDCAVSPADAPAVPRPRLRDPSGKVDESPGNHREGHPEHHGARVPRSGAGRGDGLHFTCESLFFFLHFCSAQERSGDVPPVHVASFVTVCHRRRSPSPPNAWPRPAGSRSRPRASAGPSPSSS